jgi:hypothetical protein
LIRGDAKVDLTAEGEVLHRSLREYIARMTARLLGQFDADDHPNVASGRRAGGAGARDLRLTASSSPAALTRL